jgi:hypothetical protein
MTSVQKQRIQKILLALVLVYVVPVAALGAYKLLRPKAVASGQVRYELAWDTRGTTNNTWKTNLGYTVKLERGFVVSYGVQLMSCPHTHSWLESLFSAVQSSQSALAGHGSSQDPAALEIKQLESLTQPKNSSFAAVTVHEPNYCQGFYVVAKAQGQLSGKSLSLRGTVTKNNKTTPFVLESEHAFGDLHPLVQAGKTVHLALGADPIQVRYVRRLAGLFDDLEFASGTAFEHGMTVLRNLHKNTKIVVEGGQIHMQSQ